MCVCCLSTRIYTLQIMLLFAYAYDYMHMRMYVNVYLHTNDISTLHAHPFDNFTGVCLFCRGQLPFGCKWLLPVGIGCCRVR